MREFKRILYSTKFEEYIKELGEVEGREEYYKFLRRSSLEKCILKYSEEEGKKEWERISNNIKNSGVSLKKMIEKYGEREGLEKYNEWLEKIRYNNSKVGIIERHGKDYYDDLVRRRTNILLNSNNKGYFNIALEFCLEIY